MSSRNNRVATAARKLQSGFTLIELLMVLVIIAVLVAIALPNYVRTKDKAREAESKANLHNIQLSIERFAVDTQGEYPPYLIGGDNRWMETKVIKQEGTDREILLEILHEVEREGVSDPLLRRGYMDSYPRNPFVRHGDAVHQLQAAVGDPLRNGFPEVTLGTRFGAAGNTMGQVLCEARWMTWDHHDLLTGVVTKRNTWANVQYDFYDVWQGSRVRPYLPGSFFYKAVGEIVPSGADINSAADIAKLNEPGKYNVGGKMATATYPIAVSSYMLGAWGGARTKGLDLLGEEPLVVFALANGTRQDLPPVLLPTFDGRGRLFTPPIETTGSSADSSLMIGIPPWTRGVNRSHIGPLWGSPYGASSDPQREQLTYGNPNGMPDALIMMLTPGAN